mmetsp:Transcript_94847/g.138497  ORF Transcript_94847/g.138497 Transcript_94847/m.138497 type:complete len:130 (-) Transcript_94847:248-637(-)
MARHAYVGVAAQSTANMLCCRAKAQSPCHDHVARQLLERNQRQGVLVALRGSETVLMHKGSGVWQWGKVTKLAADLGFCGVWSRECFFVSMHSYACSSCIPDTLCPSRAPLMQEGLKGSSIATNLFDQR